MSVLIQPCEPLLALSFLEWWRQPWAAHLGWTLLHSLWHLTAIAVLYGAVDRLLIRRTSQVRYVAAVLALTVMAMAPIVTWSMIEVDSVIETTGLQEYLSSSATQRHLTISEPAIELTDTPIRPNSSTLAVADDSAGLLQFTAEPSSIADPKSPAGGIEIPPVDDDNRDAWVSRLKAWLEPWLGVLVTAWLIGVTLAALRPLAGLWTQVRLRRVGLSPLPPAIHQLLSRLVVQMSIRQPLRIFSSSLVQAPAVVGYLKPLILLPVTAMTGLSTRELEAVLAHELAHVRRHDWLVNAFQLAIETVLFFHPAMWWVSQRIRQERENCCDDIAVAMVGDRILYGRLLLAMEHLRRHAPAATLGADGGSLVQRIRRLAGREQPIPRGWEDFSMVTVLMVCGLLGFFGTTYGQAEQMPPEVAQKGSIADQKSEQPQPAPRSEVSEAQPSSAVVNEKPNPSPNGEAAVQVGAVRNVELPDDWFRLDPFPGLGHVDDSGEGWRYLRLASDGSARSELGIAPEQLKALDALYDETNKRQSALRGEDVGAKRIALWNEAAGTARSLLTDAQDRRVRQVAFQRRSYHAFQDPVAQDALALTAEQRQQVELSIKAHITRINEMDAQLKRTKLKLEEEERIGERNTKNLVKVAEMERYKAGVASHRQVWTDFFVILTDPQKQKLEELRGPPVVNGQPDTTLSWNRTDKYVPPDFNYFPDDSQMGKKLDDLYGSRTQRQVDDREILETVRRGLKRTTQHQTLVLAWIGNQYIWGQPHQNPQAIEIMYHASASPDRGNTAHYAVYFGLSVVQNKTPNLLRALAEAAVDAIPDTRSRIAWGVGAKDAEAFARVLNERLESGELSDRQKIAMFDLHRQVAGKLPAHPERYAGLGLFQFEYAPKPGIKLTPEELTARFLKEIDPLEEGRQHTTRFERGMLVGGSQVRSITQRDAWVKGFLTSESLQLRSVTIIDEPTPAPPVGPMSNAVAEPPVGGIGCQLVLRWLPLDTEMVTVARGTNLKVPDSNVTEHQTDYVGWLLLLHYSARETPAERLELLKTNRPKFIVKAGGRFRKANSSGALDYDGAVVTGFVVPLPNNGQTFLESLAANKGAKSGSLNGFPAVWVPMPAIGGEPARGHWYVLVRPDLLIDGPDSPYIRTLLSRMQNTPADRAFPWDDPLWKHADANADVFALRRLGNLSHAEKRLEPRPVIGMTLSAKLGPGGSLRGALIPGPDFTPAAILSQYFNSESKVTGRQELATQFLGRAKEDNVEFMLDPVNLKNAPTQSVINSVNALLLLQ